MRIEGPKALLLGRVVHNHQLARSAWRLCDDGPVAWSKWSLNEQLVVYSVPSEGHSPVPRPGTGATSDERHEMFAGAGQSIHIIGLELDPADLPAIHELRT
jgi:hypothetical protein